MMTSPCSLPVARQMTCCPTSTSTPTPADGKPPAGRVDDRLVALLRQLDVAEVANPTADRDLYFQGVTGLPMLPFEGRSASTKMR